MDSSYTSKRVLSSFYQVDNERRVNAVSVREDYVEAATGKLFRTYNVDIATYDSGQYNVLYEPVDNVLPWSDMYPIQRIEFYVTEKGAMVYENIDEARAGIQSLKTIDPNSIIYSDEQILCAVWFLKYATVTECLKVLQARQRGNDQLFVLPSVENEYVRQRLSKLSRQGLLWLYKVDETPANAGSKNKGGVIRAYSLTEAGTEFITTASGVKYKTRLFTSAAIPDVFLGRLSENEVVKKICESPKFIAFGKNSFQHDTYDLKELTGSDIIDVDYSIDLLNESNPNKKTSLMVQYIRDPQCGREIYTEEDNKWYYRTQAIVSRAFILKKAGKDGSRGSAKVLFVCPTKDALKGILASLREMKSGEFFKEKYDDYIFTSEKAVAWAEYSHQPFQTALFKAKRVLDKNAQRLVWAMVEATYNFL